MTQPIAPISASPPILAQIEPKPLQVGPISAGDSDDLAVEALHRLVATPSVSGSEAAAVGVFVEIAARLGLTPSIDQAGNALALRPSRGPERARIILLGHIDTVPGHIPVRIQDGVLHGRGSVDAKGPLATMLLAAARAQVEEGVALEVVGAVGEETAASPGARFLAPRRSPEACIIGEPSGWDGVTLGYKGRLRLTAEISGPCAHSAGAMDSACDLAHAWWSRIRRWMDRLNHGRRGAFETITASIQGIHSGDDGLRQWARLDAGLRLPTWISPDEAARTLPDLAADPVFHAEVRIEGCEVAHEVDRNDAVVRALSSAIRAAGATPRPKRKSGTSDMNVVAPAWNCPIAAYGPGDSGLDHTPHEHIAIDEYLRSIRILTAALGTLARELQPTP